MNLSLPSYKFFNLVLQAPKELEETETKKEEEEGEEDEGFHTPEEDPEKENQSSTADPNKGRLRPA